MILGNFTFEEMNLMCIYNTGSRTGLIDSLREMRGELSPEETELRELTDSTLTKLCAMTDEDFARMAIGEMVTMGLIGDTAEVLDHHVERVKKAYPAYFDTYDQMDELRAYLDQIENLFCVGRNGQHRYNNMDHSMCTSFETVKNILSGETGKENIWNVNTEQEYHEEERQ